MRSLKLVPRAVVLFLPVLWGCPATIIPYASQRSVERSYTVGQSRAVAPGEVMVMVRSLSDAPLYEVAFDYTPPQHDLFQGGLDYPPLAKGTRFVQVATASDGEVGLERNGYGVTRPASFGRETYMPVTIWVEKGIVSSSMEGRRWTTDMLFLPVASTGVTEVARMELVFDRFDGRMLDATHREYFAGPAAPSATRPVRFDLSTSRTITHEGIAMEVTAASAERIELNVTDDAKAIWR
jgi:hypothetical protein